MASSGSRNMIYTNDKRSVVHRRQKEMSPCAPQFVTTTDLLSARFLPARRFARAVYAVGPVSVSVSLSATSWYCTKLAKCRIT